MPEENEKQSPDEWQEDAFAIVTSKKSDTKAAVDSPAENPETKEELEAPQENGDQSRETKVPGEERSKPRQVVTSTVAAENEEPQRVNVPFGNRAVMVTTRKRVQEALVEIWGSQFLLLFLVFGISCIFCGVNISVPTLTEASFPWLAGLGHIAMLLFTGRCIYLKYIGRENKIDRKLTIE